MYYDLLPGLTEAHDRCLQAWDQAFASGDTAAVEAFPAEAYEGFFGHGGGEWVNPVLREEAVLGIRRFAGAVCPAVHKTTGRTIHPRSDHEAIVAYERQIEKDGRTIARFLVLQTWRRENGAWQVWREVAEHF